MANDFFTATGNPAAKSQGSSSVMRAEFSAIEDGFDKLPTLTGNGSKIVAVNSGGTALESITTTGTGSAVRATSPTLVTPNLGTPSAIVLTNASGTASININGTVGATTPATGSFTTVTTSGVITGPDGSASAPTYSFSSSGNTDNGMYLSAANEVSLATAGTKFLTLTSDGRLYGTAIHNNSGAVTGTTNQYIASGTFTPTLGDSTNVANSSISSAQWIRVGNVVTVSGRLTVELTDFANPAEFTLTLPIAVSGSPSAGNFAGVIACTTFDNAASGITGINASPWKVIMGITITGGSGLVPWSYHYTYRIT